MAKAGSHLLPKILVNGWTRHRDFTAGSWIVFDYGHCRSRHCLRCIVLIVIDGGEMCLIVAKATEQVKLPLPCNLQGLNPRSKVKSHLAKCKRNRSS